MLLNQRRRLFSKVSSQFPSLNQNNNNKKGLKIFRRIVLGSVLGTYGYYQWENYSRNMELAKKLEIPFYKILLYKAFPFSAMSSLAGWIGNLKIESVNRRKFLFGLYSRIYGCNLEEAASPIESYESFGQFFSRNLKKDARPIEKINGLVSACDGTLLHCGELSEINSGTIYPEQIKGSFYSLNELIGQKALKGQVEKESQKSIYYCTIYLAPGDYHRFHAPTKFRIDSVEKISGEVLSVAPWMMKLVSKLLCMNERVAISGKWKHGFMYYVPVGAANVGSIKIDSRIKPNSLINAGAEIGHFELGSTLVLIFEAPSGSKWKVQNGEKIKLGQPLFQVKDLIPSWWNPFN